jgi:diadenosine tetraphosphatase ApaH/serine/threonine PP2A family protein phosphatase
MSISKNMTDHGYDVIGDIHGHADALCRLLIKLGYAELQGVFRHDSRKVIFVGDFVDRGPEQIEVLRIARKMCEAGTASAVLGNHEFNAIGWATSDGSGGHLRKHSKKNDGQHAEFLSQLGEGSLHHDNAINWFRQLPVWLDLPGFRVVHACWHDRSRVALRPYLDAGNRLTDEGIREAHHRGSEAYKAVEILLKGPEQRLPVGKSFVDQSGNKREEVRLRWWDPDATTFRKAAIGVDDQLEELPNDKITTDFQYLDSTPVLFGHYWILGEPTIINSRAACLDFSVARSGYLTAYRWSAEPELSSKNLVYVPAESPLV